MNMYKSIGVCAIGIFLLCFIGNVCPLGGDEETCFIEKRIEKISDAPDVVFSAIVSPSHSNGGYLGVQENKLDYVNYFIEATEAITALRQSNVLKAKDIVDCLMETFNRYGYFPRPPYERYEYGWTSSMDAPTAAVASQYLYETTGDYKYKEFVDKLVKYIPNDVRDNGFVIKDGDSKWMLEYASKDISHKNAEFVLNGSMLGFLNTAILAQITGDVALNKLVNQQVESYKKKFSNYWSEDESWCYYALNYKGERVINPPHYILYEIRLMDAVYMVTGEQIFADEANKRRELLKRYYKLWVIDNNGEKMYRFFWDSAPHYYYIDIYDTTLKFYDKENNLIKKEKKQGRGFEDSVMSGHLDANVSKVTWSIENEAWSMDLGELEIVPFTGMEKELLVGTYMVKEGGELNGNILMCDSAAEKTVVEITLDGKNSMTNDSVYVMNFENESNDALSVRLFLYDISGNVVSRYLQEILPGKNSLSFAKPGFVGGKLFNNEIAKIKYYIVNNEKNNNEVALKCGDIYRFNNVASFMDYVMTSDYRLGWTNK